MMNGLVNKFAAKSRMLIKVLIAITLIFLAFDMIKTVFQYNTLSFLFYFKAYISMILVAMFVRIHSKTTIAEMRTSKNPGIKALAWLVYLSGFVVYILASILEAIGKETEKVNHDSEPKMGPDGRVLNSLDRKIAHAEGSASPPTEL